MSKPVTTKVSNSQEAEDKSTRSLQAIKVNPFRGKTGSQKPRHTAEDHRLEKKVT